MRSCQLMANPTRTDETETVPVADGNRAKRSRRTSGTLSVGGRYDKCIHGPLDCNERPDDPGHGVSSRVHWVCCNVHGKSVLLVPRAPRVRRSGLQPLPVRAATFATDGGHGFRGGIEFPRRAVDPQHPSRRGFDLTKNQIRDTSEDLLQSGLSLFGGIAEAEEGECHPGDAGETKQRSNVMDPYPAETSEAPLHRANRDMHFPGKNGGRLA